MMNNDWLQRTLPERRRRRLWTTTTSATKTTVLCRPRDRQRKSESNTGYRERNNDRRSTVDRRVANRRLRNKTGSRDATSISNNHAPSSELLTSLPGVARRFSRCKQLSAERGKGCFIRCFQFQIIFCFYKAFSHWSILCCLSYIRKDTQFAICSFMLSI